MSWWQVSVRIGEESIDVFKLDQLAVELGCEVVQELGLEEDEIDAILGDAAYCGGELPDGMLELLEEQAMNGGRQYFFAQQEKSSDFLAALNDLGDAIEVALEEVKDQDWNAKWREHYHGLTIPGKLKVIPSWESGAMELAENEIAIYPGMGFGTGEHETTQGCLKVLCELDHAPGRVLDYGCGSGILGIAADKLLSPGQTIYFDIDHQALENCKQNLHLNTPRSNEVRIVSELPPTLGEFELVFANILADVLISNSKEIIALSSRDLILSGILQEQKASVIDAYSQHFNLITEHIDGHWCTLRMEKK